MKHYKNFLIIGIDHGYGNIKTAGTVTPTFTKNTLFFEGSYYLIGEGHKEYLTNNGKNNFIKIIYF